MCRCTLGIFSVYIFIFLSFAIMNMLCLKRFKTRGMTQSTSSKQVLTLDKPENTSFTQVFCLLFYGHPWRRSIFENCKFSAMFIDTILTLFFFVTEYTFSGKMRDSGDSGVLLGVHIFLGECLFRGGDLLGVCWVFSRSRFLVNFA